MSPRRIRHRHARAARTAAHVIAAISLLAGSAEDRARADEAPLYETVITASPERDNAPHGTITAATMRDRAIRTTPEALEETPGVWVQQTNYGGGAPIIRGLLGNRLLLKVDGVPLNNSTFRGGPKQRTHVTTPGLQTFLRGKWHPTLRWRAGADAFLDVISSRASFGTIDGPGRSVVMHLQGQFL